jgi:proline iminopeptidase
MSSYRSYDGAELHFRVSGAGEPLLIVPGGPGRDADYLEDLGGLASICRRALITMEPRGTGASPAPDDPAAYAAGNLAIDLDALRVHLSLPELDVLAHSAGCDVALLYGAAHPDQVRRLVLITPSTRVVGLEDTEQEWESQLAKRRHEPWFAAAKQALDDIDAHGFTPQLRQAMSPLLYGAWSDSARQHAATDTEQRNVEAARAFREHDTDSSATRTALARLTAPVRIVIGELDMAPGPELAANLAALFGDASVVVQPDAGHFPWVDDPLTFAKLAAAALYE